MAFSISDLQIPPPENGEQFETLCLDLYKKEFGDKTQKNGRSGQSQDGIDIFEPDQNIGIQCKKRDYNGKIKKEELRQEVKKAKKFKPDLKRFILATTCKRDAKIQEEARFISKDHQKQQLFSVEIHSWEELKAFFDKHPKVYNKHYPPPFTPSNLISVSQSESHHQELNRIRDLINQNQPQTALKQLEQFKKDKWEQLVEKKEKYKVLTNIAWAKWLMKQGGQASELFIKALQFNPEDENANTNCAVAYFTLGDMDNAKKYIAKAKDLNPLNITAYIIEIQIKDREDVSLEDIVSSLPTAIKEKNKTAHIMSHISIKRKQYIEAKKWLDIFYTQGYKEWKDTLVMADYADMSIQLILSQPDTISGKRATDNLKDKIKEISDICKKLTTGEKYSELSRLYPEWHINYAKALEFSGELDKAIFVLKKGSEYFPNEAIFKVELARLFEQKKDISKSIDILENEVGLNFLMTGNFADFVDKKYSSNKIKISKKDFFHLALVLIELYFHTQQESKAWALLDKLMQDPSIDEKSRIKANQQWIRRKIEAIRRNKTKTKNAKEQIESVEQKLNAIVDKTGNTVRNLILKAKIEEAKARIHLKAQAPLSQGQDFTPLTDKNNLETPDSNLELSSLANIKANKGQIENHQKHIKRQKQYLKEAGHVLKADQQNKKTNTSNKAQESSNFEIKHPINNKEILFQELYNSKMYQEAEPLLEEMTNKNLNHPDIFHLLNVYFENGKNQQAIELANALLKKFPYKAEIANRLFLIYESLGDKEKAIQTYENFLNSTARKPVDFEKDTAFDVSSSYKVHIEHKNSKNKKIKTQNDLIKIELALAYIRNKQIHKAKKLLYQADFEQNTDSKNPSVSKEAINQKALSDKPSITSRFDIQNMSLENLSRLAWAYMKTGYIKQALETQYHCIKKYPREMEPQTIYFNLCQSLNYPEVSDFEQKSQSKKDRNLSFLHPKKVELDCFILLEEIKTQSLLPIVIEKDGDHPPNHELSPILLGKQVGDEIIYVRKTYQIKEIKSKYLYKFQEIAESAEKKFGSKSFLKLAYVPKKDDLEKPDIEKLTNAIKVLQPDKQQQVFLDQILQFYRERKIPIGVMAKPLSKHPIDVINGLMASQTDKFISSVPKWRKNHNIEQAIGNKTSILMDISSLMIMSRIKMEKVLEKSDFNLYVCPSTLDSLRKFVEQIATHTTDGLLQLGVDQRGQLVKNETSAESMQQSLNFYLQLIKWAEDHCQIKTIPSNFVFSRQKKLKWEKSLGKEFLDPILTVYGEKDMILLSEDAMLRVLAQGLHQKINQTGFEKGATFEIFPSYKVHKNRENSNKTSIDNMQSEKIPSHFISCGLLDLIDYWTEQAVLDESQMVRFKAGLVTLNHSYIPIDHKILLFLLKENEYSFTHFCFQRGLFFLGPVSDLPGVINVVANFLIELGQDSGLLPYRKQMIANEVLNKAVLGRPESKRSIAYQIWQGVQMKTKLLPILQNEIGLYIMEWAKPKIY